ncbi:MAG: glucose-1-phosphate adenylyltransferase [Nitrospira sp.]|nr:glucose-1-phosphate adenylyltransferase [Nitrospira sp.]
MAPYDMTHQPKVLALILAGGKGERLMPLTEVRSKPAVPFGGTYRIIDFVLSNFYNSGITAMHVMVQYRSQSLIEHLRRAWRIGDGEGQFVTVVPPQMNLRRGWYEGTADAVYQNLNLIQDAAPDLVAVFGADHIYRMDIRQMLRFHVERQADVSVAALPMPLTSARGFGIIEVDRNDRIVGFEEKPSEPKPMPMRPDRALSSMGNYLFTTDVLLRALNDDAGREGTHDFGRDILPCLLRQERVMAYNFRDNDIPGLNDYEEPAYWRDVGTIPAYWQANMDLLGETPLNDLRNADWPIRGESSRGLPASLVNCYVDHALIGEGSRIVEADIRRCVIGRYVRIEPGAQIEDSVILDHTSIGAKARLRRVVIDRGNAIPAGAILGHEEAGAAEVPGVSSAGLTVVPKAVVQQDASKQRLSST